MSSYIVNIYMITIVNCVILSFHSLNPSSYFCKMVTYIIKIVFENEM